MKKLGLTAAAACVALLSLDAAHAQGRGAGPPPPANAQVGAPVDLTGQWVSVISEDWRWRMITPPKGDYASMPLNPAGKAAADKWDLAADNAAGPSAQCRVYGVGGILRVPGRIRTSWADPNTFKMETDAGQQTRLFRFVGSAPGGVMTALTRIDPPPATRTLQGETKAQWFKQPQSRGLGFGGGPGAGGALRAITRYSTGGYLRKNGVPYSQDAVITEQINYHKESDNSEWLTITHIVDDPANLTMPFITSTSFKKETDLSKWSPTPCMTDVPLAPPVTKASG